MNKNSNIKTFIIMLSDIPNEDSDVKFATYIEQNKFEFWRRTPLNWILAVPNNTTLEEILNATHEAYGRIFITVLNVDIKGFGGVYMKTASKPTQSPFQWFEEIHKKGFIPKWESEKQKELK